MLVHESAHEMTTNSDRGVVANSVYSAVAAVGLGDSVVAFVAGALYDYLFGVAVHFLVSLVAAAAIVVLVDSRCLCAAAKHFFLSCYCALRHFWLTLR